MAMGGVDSLRHFQKALSSAKEIKDEYWLMQVVDMASLVVLAAFAAELYDSLPTLILEAKSYIHDKCMMDGLDAVAQRACREVVKNPPLWRSMALVCLPFFCSRRSLSSPFRPSDIP